MFQFQVANLVIEVESDKSELLKEMQEFKLKKHAPADLSIVLNSAESIDIPEGRIISDENAYYRWLKKISGDEGYYIYYTETMFGSILILAEIDITWRKAIITCRDFSKQTSGSTFIQQTNFYAHSLLGVVYRYTLLHHMGMVIHSSALKYKDKALVFSAPSGTGKSTHTGLWRRYKDDVSMLNDDTPAVRIIDDKPYVFGTPWSGSTAIYSNDSAPLEAIVILEQASNNKIRKLQGQEAISRLMPRVFLPYFDVKMMDKAMSIFEKIIATVPVYLLQCRPDQEAVEMVYQCLK